MLWLCVELVHAGASKLYHAPDKLLTLHNLCACCMLVLLMGPSCTWRLPWCALGLGSPIRLQLLIAAKQRRGRSRAGAPK